MSNQDEIIGQLYQQLQTEAAQHRNTVGMLAALKRGEKLPDGRVLTLGLIVVDERAGAWQVVPPEPEDGAEDAGVPPEVVERLKEQLASDGDPASDD